MIGRLFKFIGYLAVLAIIGLVAFAYLGPMVMPDAFAPPQTSVTKPIALSVE